MRPGSDAGPHFFLILDHRQATEDNAMTSITAARGVQHPVQEGVQPVEPITTQRDGIIKAGELTLGELPIVAKEEIWSRWMKIAAAIEAIRTEAMFLSQVNVPDGHNKKYQRAHAELIQRHRFDQLRKGVRSHLIDCLRHRAEIESWLSGLPADQRLRMTHPVVILRNWRLATTTPNSTTKRPSAVAELKAKITALEGQIALLRHGDGGTLTAKDSPRDAARVIRAIFSERKLSEIRRLLGKDDVTVA
jgi:hypothetical protein